MAKNDKATEGTYSTKPFITHDGIDNNGDRAEVKVVMGFGDIIDIEDSKNGKSKKITFAVSNSEWNSSGWTRDPKLHELVEKAKETGEPIHFRIETRRKDGIDRNKPFSELVTERGAEIVKSLAAVKYADDEEWTISMDAVTRFDEDPVTGGLIKASEQDIEKLRPSQRTQSSGNSRNGNFEPAPYVAIWRDQLNPGTIGVAIPLTFLSNLLEYERESGQEIPKEKRKDIAIVLMRIANQLQKDIYTKYLQADYPGVDLTAGSHTRARALIFEVLRSFYPLSESIIADEEEFKLWQKNVYSTCYSMWVWAMDVASEFIE